MSQSLWLVEYLAEALREYEELDSRQERMGVHNVVDKLSALGPMLRPPHMKSLKGEPNLMELRPRGGRSPVRLIYARIGDGYKVLAIACTKPDFDRAVSRARERAAQYSIALRR